MNLDRVNWRYVYITLMIGVTTGYMVYFVSNDIMVAVIVGLLVIIFASIQLGYIRDKQMKTEQEYYADQDIAHQTMVSQIQRDETKCASCLKQLDNDDIYCPFCGFKRR